MALGSITWELKLAPINVSSTLLFSGTSIFIHLVTVELEEGYRVVKALSLVARSLLVGKEDMSCL